MSDAQLVDLHPADAPLTPANREADQREHIGTYKRFVHILMWFVFHVPLLLGGLYIMTLGGSMVLGALLAATGIVVLMFGIVSTVSQPA